MKPTDILTEEAIDLLAQRLVTPLQVEYCLTLALEHAYRFGEKPVSADVIEAMMAPDINALEPTLTRYGYNVKALSELLNRVSAPPIVDDGNFSPHYLASVQSISDIKALQESYLDSFGC